MNRAAMSEPVSVNTSGDTAVIKIGKLVITVESGVITIKGKRMRVEGDIILEKPASISSLLPPPTSFMKRIFGK